jgi:hypothetical protein
VVAKQFIADALMEIGILGADETADAADADLGLRHLQAAVDLFQADRLLLYTVLRAPYALIPGRQTYTIGPTGADFLGARPLWLSSVGVIPVGQTTEYPIVDYVYRTEWLREPEKTLTDSYPRRYFYEPSDVAVGTFVFWPIPTTAASVVIATPVPLVTPLSLDTDLTFPPGGYYEAWRLNLARRLQRPFEVPDDAVLRVDADRALAQIRRLNDEVAPWSRSDEALTGRGGYDIRGGVSR